MTQWTLTLLTPQHSTLLHDLDEIAPGLERGGEGRAVVRGVARHGARDVLGLQVACLEVRGYVVSPFDPDGHVDVEAATVLVLLAVPGLLDGADGGLVTSAEEVFSGDDDDDLGNPLGASRMLQPTPQYHDGRPRFRREQNG